MTASSKSEGRVCKQVWNRDREEMQWHDEWSCDSSTCASPHCRRLRAEGYPSARAARRGQNIERFERSREDSERSFIQTADSIHVRHAQVT